jgi:ribosomal protein L24
LSYYVSSALYSIQFCINKHRRPATTEFVGIIAEIKMCVNIYNAMLTTDRAKQGEAGRVKVRQGEERRSKTKQGKARRGKARQGKSREGN